MIGKGLQTGAGVQPWHKRALAGLLLALMLTVGLFAMVSPASAQEGDEEMQGAMSFYALSSSLSSFLGSSLSPDFDGERDAMWNQVTDNGGSGGSMLGYADSNRNDGAGWLTSSWTAGSHTMSYSSLTVDTGDSEENRLTGPTAYTYMGAALNGLGLDKTQSGMSLGFTSLIGGGILYLLYAASTGINTVFWGVIWLLQKLNPFQLFYPAVAAINPEFAEGMVGGDTDGLPPFLGGLASAIAQWYGALNTVAWAAMVPVFLGVLLIGFFLFKKMDKGSAVKKFVVRLLYIGLGLPLIGSMYTGTLNAVESEISGSNPNATQVITETLVDFENWAMRSNLYIPAGADISWSSSSARPGPSSLQNVRDTARAINISATPGMDQPWWQDVMIPGQPYNDPDNSKRRFDATLDMITRYMMGNTVKASDYETHITAQLSTGVSDPEERETVTAWFKGFDGKSAEELNDPGTEYEGRTLAENIPNNGVITVNKGVGLSYSEGQLTSLPGTSSTCYFFNPTPTNCSIAPLAMYNYLNTTFGPEAFTVYSAERSPSEATREVHSSVNLVGTGLTSFMFWMNAVIMLLSFVLIGTAYMLGMLIANFKRTFQLFAAIPFATLGAIGGIAKVIVYSFALIIEILVTVFLYMIVMEFIMTLPQIVETPFQLMLGGTGGTYGVDEGSVGWLDGDFGGGLSILQGSAFVIVTGLITMITVIAFTVMAMRVRKSVIKAIEEAVTKIVNKFLDTSVGAPSGGQLMPALAAGAGAAAGGAAMSKMLGAGASAASGGANPGGIGDRGPDGGGQIALDDKAGSGGSEGPDGPDGANDSSDPNNAPGGGGGAMAMSLSSDGSQDEDEKGRALSTNGSLSDPKDGKDGTSEAGKVPGSQDGVDSVADSVENSMDAYAKSDKEKLNAVGETGKAAYHGGMAAARGAAGDAAGAASEAGKAAGNLQKAGEAGKRSAELSKQAGESSVPPGEAAGGQAVGKPGEQDPSKAGLAAAAAGRGTGKPGEAAKPGAKPGQGAKAAQAAQAAKPGTKPGEAAKPGAKAAQAAKSGQAIKPGQSAQAAKPGVKAAATGATKSAQAAKSGAKAAGSSAGAAAGKTAQAAQGARKAASAAKSVSAAASGAPAAGSKTASTAARAAGGAAKVATGGARAAGGAAQTAGSVVSSGAKAAQSVTSAGAKAAAAGASAQAAKTKAAAQVVGGAAQMAGGVAAAGGGAVAAGGGVAAAASGTRRVAPAPSSGSVSSGTAPQGAAPAAPVPAASAPASGPAPLSPGGGIEGSAPAPAAAPQFAPEAPAAAPQAAPEVPAAPAPAAPVIFGGGGIEAPAPAAPAPAAPAAQAPAAQAPVQDRYIDLPDAPAPAAPMSAPGSPIQSSAPAQQGSSTARAAAAAGAAGVLGAVAANSSGAKGQVLGGAATAASGVAGAAAMRQPAPQAPRSQAPAAPRQAPAPVQAAPWAQPVRGQQAAPVQRSGGSSMQAGSLPGQQAPAQRSGGQASRPAQRNASQGAAPRSSGQQAPAQPARQASAQRPVQQAPAQRPVPQAPAQGGKRSGSPAPNRLPGQQASARQASAQRPVQPAEPQQVQPAKPQQGQQAKPAEAKPRTRNVFRRRGQRPGPGQGDTSPRPGDGPGGDTTQ